MSDIFEARLQLFLGRPLPYKTIDNVITWKKKKKVGYRLSVAHSWQIILHPVFDTLLFKIISRCFRDRIVVYICISIMQILLIICALIDKHFLLFCIFFIRKSRLYAFFRKSRKRFVWEKSLWRCVYPVVQTTWLSTW